MGKTYKEKEEIEIKMMNEAIEKVRLISCFIIITSVCLTYSPNIAIESSFILLSMIAGYIYVRNHPVKRKGIGIFIIECVSFAYFFLHAAFNNQDMIGNSLRAVLLIGVIYTLSIHVVYVTTAYSIRRTLKKEWKE